jgi:hypothetical protein
MSGNVQEDRTWGEAIRFAVVFLLVFNAVFSAVLGYKQSISVFTEIRPLQTVEDTAMLAVVAGVITLLNRLHPVFQWWVGQPFGAKGAAFNFNLLPALTRGLGPSYLVLLAFIIPQIAAYEESLFRRGTTSWQDAVLRSLLFGVTHLLVGVPVSAAIAIAGAGLWFSYCYFDGGVTASTVHHTTYDLVAVLVLLFLVLCRREALLESIKGEKT